MLTLPIKKKWFDMIVSGEKKEEYREIKPYYDSRFMNAFGFLLVGGQMVYGEAAPEEIRKPWPVLVVFRNGYSKDSPDVAEDQEFAESKNAESGNAGGYNTQPAPAPQSGNDGFMPAGDDSELPFV